MDRLSEDQATDLGELYELRWLHERVNNLIRAATPSLENNQRQGPKSFVEGYFDLIRDALQRVGRLHSQLSRDRPQLRFIESGIVQAKTQVRQAERRRKNYGSLAECEGSHEHGLDVACGESGQRWNSRCRSQ